MEKVHNWMLLVEGLGTLGAYEDSEILDDVWGSREEAREALWEQVDAFRPRRPMIVRRWWVYEDTDGYLARYEGSSGGHYVYRFHMRALLGEQQTT